MHKGIRLAAFAAGFAGLTGSAVAQDMTAEVVHVWTSAGERGASLVLKNAYEALGGTWVDVAIAGSGGPFRTMVNRILAGDPPNAGQFSSSRDYVDLQDKGELADIEEVASAGNWRDLLPEPVIDAISYQGKIYLAPMNIHGPNWIWYNKDVLAKSGVEEVPNKIDDSFFAALDKVKEAGFIPFAVAGQPAQLRFLYEGVMIGLGGKEHWNAVWRDKNEDAIRSDLQRQIFENFKRLRDYTDEGYAGRAWNPTINMVISGQAGFDLLGDWAKAEFLAAGQTPEEDFGCILAGDVIIVHSDMMGFPVIEGDPNADAVRKMLAEMMFSKQVQHDFNVAKGSIPTRTDVDTSDFDVCAKKALAAFRNPETVVGNARTYMSPPAVGDYMDLLSEYFDAPDMTTDEVIDRYADIVLNALN